MLTGSQFVLHSLLRDDELLGALWREGALDAARSAAGLRAVPSRRCWPTTPLVEADLSRALRRLRQREMTRLAWRDIAGLASTEQTLREVSAFAAAMIGGATTAAAQLLESRHGTVPTPRRTALVVLGMGQARRR